MIRILIVDGVTGSGKTSTIQWLMSRHGSSITFISEDQTLGSIMEDIRDTEWRAHPRFPALESVLDRIEREIADEPNRLFLIERFHLTSYALFPIWDCFRTYDNRLRKLGSAIVLLSYPTELAEQRSIMCFEREKWAESMDEWYGSREKAIKAVQLSQGFRFEALSHTSLPFLHVDTRNKDWLRYSATIEAYWL